VAKFTKHTQGSYAHWDFIVIIAGDAAHRPEFLDTLRSVAKSIPQLRVDHGVGRLPKVELVISDDPTFAAARGAAFWFRMLVDWSYCDGLDVISQYDMVSDGRIEL
jgi:hypothetical protein